MRRIKILLAEDSEFLAEVMKDFLGLQGFRVVIARNGMEALKHPALNSVDLIIMDIDMPIMGGIQATSKLRALGFSRPILAHSGEVDFQLRSDFRAAGFSAHVAKPIDFPEFVSLLQSLLPETQRHQPDTRFHVDIEGANSLL